MKSQGYATFSRRPRIQEKGRVDVTIFYDELDNGMRAKEIAEYTVHRFKLDCELALNVYNFAVLAIGEVAECARRGCACADLIIFSLKDPVWLTRETVMQIAGWISHNQSHDCMALCSLDPGIENNQHMEHIQSAMQLLVRKSGVRCQVIYPVELQNRLQPEVVLNSPRMVEPSLISKLKGRVNPHQAWGINE